MTETKHTSRETIESRLLAALTDEDKVAVVLTKRDLDDLILTVTDWRRPGVPTRDHTTPERESRVSDLANGLVALRAKAFGG